MFTWKLMTLFRFSLERPEKSWLEKSEQVIAAIHEMHKINITDLQNGIIDR
jgi:hypothetical protein